VCNRDYTLLLYSTKYGFDVVELWVGYKMFLVNVAGNIDTIEALFNGWDT
jgi:hypothetical protein